MLLESYIVKKNPFLPESLNKGHELSLEMIRTAITHDTQDEELSFIGIWENTIERLKVENNGARYTTAEFYENALKSFRKILWKEHIDGFHIGLDHIRKWNEGMKNGVADASGKIVGRLVIRHAVSICAIAVPSGTNAFKEGI